MEWVVLLKIVWKNSTENNIQTQRWKGKIKRTITIMNHNTCEMVQRIPCKHPLSDRIESRMLGLLKDIGPRLSFQKQLLMSSGDFEKRTRSAIHNQSAGFSSGDHHHMPGKSAIWRVMLTQHIQVINRIVAKKGQTYWNMRSAIHFLWVTMYFRTKKRVHFFAHRWIFLDCV